MAESKLLDEDRDEWFYHTMNKYSNLYMFELEFPLDTLEVINETSLCVSGMQTFSKKCELLQLCVPPKLLRSEDEEGLCKDRDFKILSGGYADGQIQQIKAVQKSPNLVATYQEGYSGVVIYQVGHDERATIIEKHRLPLSTPSQSTGKSLCCMNDAILLATAPTGTDSKGILINERKLAEGWSSSSTSSPSKPFHIWKTTTSDLNCGQVTKLMSWDDNNTCIFLTSSGTVALYDLRTGVDSPSIYFHAAKSINNQNQSQSQPQPLLSSGSEASIIFTFDCLPEENKIGVLDSCGGYETFDPRNGSGNAKPISLGRCLLPEFSQLAGVYPNWFNIEYEKTTKMREKGISSSARFIISGLKRECVPVFQEVNVNCSGDNNSEITTTADDIDRESNSVESVFSHDGHTKPVSHSIWHPVAKDLIFSASVDAVLHAWQFITEEK